MDDHNEIPEGIREHLRQIEVWLRENVTIYRDVKAVTLFDFKMDWARHGGEFKVAFDDQVCPMEFSFAIGDKQNGRVGVFHPVFTSPLGAPASYSAVEMPEDVARAIEDCLNQLFPPLRPMGLNRETGKMTNMSTPFTERIRDMAAYEAAKERVSTQGFNLVVQVQ